MSRALTRAGQAVRAQGWRLRLKLFSNVLGRYQYLRRMTTASASEVENAQRERLAELLLHAGKNVPYYRETLHQSGVVVDGRVDLSRFENVPLLDKTIIRDNMSRLVSSDSDARNTYSNTSGGSTGKPVTFIQDRATHEWKMATKYLFDSWTGYRPGEPFALLWGAGRDMDDSSLRARLGLWLRNELRLDSYLMSPDVMDEYIARLNAFSPELVLAYAQSAYQLAAHAEENGQSIRPPRAVMTSATTLEPAMRAKIESAFGTQVFDRYGSREVGDIACENGDGNGLVISPLTHLVEILDENGRAVDGGVPGEIVVTLLTNYSMPLIRFRIGDAGVFGEPSGSIAWPRLAQVIGRVTDIFYTAAGKQIYGGFFTRQFYGREWVDQFQIVQEDYEHIVVRIVPTGGITSDHLTSEQRSLSAAFRDALGENCRVDFEIVDEIEPGPTGKRRYTISNVERPA